MIRDATIRVPSGRVSSTSVLTSTSSNSTRRRRPDRYACSIGCSATAAATHATMNPVNDSGRPSAARARSTRRAAVTSASTSPWIRWRRRPCSSTSM